MEWIIPGTVLTGSREEVDGSIRQIEGMFLAGGITRSQVARVTGLEAYAIQNWVQRGFLSSPVNKRYSLRQFSRIAIINMLKSAMSLDRICGLLGYVNGALNDESDDLIDDSVLYFMFLRLASSANHIGGNRNWDELIPEILQDYSEPVPGAKERIDRVLRIMLTAWIGVCAIAAAENMIAQLPETSNQCKGE